MWHLNVLESLRVKYLIKLSCLSLINLTKNFCCLVKKDSLVVTEREREYKTKVSIVNLNNEDLHTKLHKQK